MTLKLVLLPAEAGFNIVPAFGRPIVKLMLQQLHSSLDFQMMAVLIIEKGLAVVVKLVPLNRLCQQAGKRRGHRICLTQRGLGRRPRLIEKVEFVRSIYLARPSEF